MIIDITRLNSNIDDSVDISLDYIFTKSELENTELMNLNCHIEGSITKDSLNQLHFTGYIDGVMVLPCAVTLEPTEYSFSADIDDNIEERLENSKKYTNTIDIFPIIWENILMEIPMRVVNEKAKDAKLEGNGWKLITDEDENTSSPFDELKDLL